MNDARQELIARINKMIENFVQPLKVGSYPELLDDCRAALSADASATPVAWMYDNGTENYFFQRERQDAPLNAKAGWTETPLYSCRSIPQQDEPSTPVARQEEPKKFCRHSIAESHLVGLWNGPIGKCSCCGSTFGYIDSGSAGTAGVSWRTWYPKDLCGACGGEYREAAISPAPAAVARESQTEEQPKKFASGMFSDQNVAQQERSDDDHSAIEWARRQLAIEGQLGLDNLVRHHLKTLLAAALSARQEEKK